MSDADCVGRGAGWGTIAGRRLCVLMLAGSGDQADAERIRRAIALRHDVELVVKDGLFGALAGARAANEIGAELVHAVGVRGVAKSAETIALGRSIPLVASVGLSDMEARAGRAKRRAERAAAVIVSGGDAADRLRASGLERDIYVLPLPPADRSEDGAYIGALEVVYGRVFGASEDGEVAAAPELVQLGGRKGAR